MGERVLPTVQALSEAAKTQVKEAGGESQTTPRNKYAKAQEPDKGSKAGGGVQLNGSAGVMGGDDEFSYC